MSHVARKDGVLHMDGVPLDSVAARCGTPCYVFEMEGPRILEATCLVCGNDEVGLFSLGEEAGAEDE